MSQRCSSDDSDVKGGPLLSDEKVGRPQAAEVKQDCKSGLGGLRDVRSAFADASLRSRESPEAPQNLLRGFSLLFDQNALFTSHSKAYTDTTYRSPIFRSVSIGSAAMAAGYTDPKLSVDGILKGSTRGSKVKDVHRKPPKPPGGYIEASTTFYTATKPSTAMQIIRAILGDMGVDFTENSTKFKFKCETYPRGYRLPFNIRIFTHGSEYAVEMQRRSGDCICFARIYKNFLRRCAKRGLCAKLEPPEPKGSLDFEGDFVLGEMQGSELESSLKPLVEMAASEYVDVKSSAVCSLAQLTTGKAVKQWMRKNVDSNSKLLKQLLVAKNQEIHRPAVTIVANLSTEKDFSAAFNTRDCLSILIKLLDSENAQVVRESSRALKNIAVARKRFPSPEIEMRRFCTEYSSTILKMVLF
uniref:Uncharacterized protein n=1 Tax=Amorphochlora amoebiformis TaxID=1561963 RepID=A0A7S0GR38_9EUKA|mmetsp:Transcript_12269/g.19443  ORF Transcript_12269/g.19443 Transcript_12269/m.19443 type:complete len:413 (+) Transcript_12269:113-1351(+)